MGVLRGARRRCCATHVFSIRSSFAPMTTPEGDTRILAIDPGITTGIAGMVNGKIVFTSTAQIEDQLRNTIRVFKAEDVVCEKGPVFARHHRGTLDQVERIVEEECEDVQWVTPSQWKNTPAARGEVPNGITIHERDACGIAHWYNHTKGATRDTAGTDTA